MIPGLESIPEHPFCGFDSDSDSRIKRNHNAYRGVIVVGLESNPESDFHHGYDYDSATCYDPC